MFFLPHHPLATSILLFLLWLAHLTYNVFKVHPCCSMCQNFLLFKKGWIYSIEYICHILFIHSSVGGHLDYFHHLDIVNNATMNKGVELLFEPFLLLLLDIYPEVELLDHIVFLCLIFWGIIILFCRVVAPFYIPSSNAQVLQFLHIFISTYYISVFLIASLMGVKC